jgi:hypothetical protein
VKYPRTARRETRIPTPWHYHLSYLFVLLLVGFALGVKSPIDVSALPMTGYAISSENSNDSSVMLELISNVRDKISPAGSNHAVIEGFNGIKPLNAQLDQDGILYIELVKATPLSANLRMVEITNTNSDESCTIVKVPDKISKDISKFNIEARGCDLTSKNNILDFDVEIGYDLSYGSFNPEKTSKGKIKIWL